MNKALSVVILFVSLSAESQTFSEQQLSYPRVREARDYSNNRWQQLFVEKNVPFPPEALYIRAFKYEKEFEVWVKSGESWKLIKTFDICKISGELGPKRKEGDGQIPEGFYHISHFNPTSDYHLSLKINYPNASDGILSNQQRPGGDIFIHGECVTIGCLPMTNDGIKEIYWLCVLARNSGQSRIPVSIFPARMDDSNFDLLKLICWNRPSLLFFWTNLKEGFDYFETYRMLPTVSIDRGKYVFR